MTASPGPRPTGAGVGRVRRLRRGLRPVRRAPAARRCRTGSTGCKVVVDGAHGAAAPVSPEAFPRAGAEVVAIGAEPDGLNINDGVRLHPPRPAQGRRRGARRGPRHRPRRRRRPLPGRRRRPAPRSTATRSWPSSRVAMRERGALRRRHPRRHRDEQPRAVHGDGARGHPRAADRGRRPLRAGGDARRRLRARRRAVRARHHARPRAPPATACSPACMLAARVAATGRTLADLGAVMTRLPQVLVNVRASTRAGSRADDGPAVGGAPPSEAELGGTGRVLLRPSGTEPLVRVMVEAPTQEQARCRSPTASPGSWSRERLTPSTLARRGARVGEGSEWAMRRVVVGPGGPSRRDAVSPRHPEKRPARRPVVPHEIPEHGPVHHRRQRPGRAGRPGPQRGRGGRPRARQARQRLEPQGQPRDALRRGLGLVLQQRARPDRDRRRASTAPPS